MFYVHACINVMGGLDTRQNLLGHQIEDLIVASWCFTDCYVCVTIHNGGNALRKSSWSGFNKKPLFLHLIPMFDHLTPLVCH